jgi:hypothetical protein
MDCLRRNTRSELARSRNARILDELVDVAAWRPEVHPAVAALIFRAVNDLDTARSELAGCRLEIIHEKAHNRPRREMTVHLSIGSEDLNLAAVRQLEDLKPWNIKVRLQAKDVLKEVDGRLKVVGTSTDPGELDNLHASS